MCQTREDTLCDFIKYTQEVLFMDKEIKDALAVRRKMVILSHARLCENEAKAYREFEIPRSSFYKCKKAFDGQPGATLN